jgi:hypothetical protein
MVRHSLRPNVLILLPYVGENYWFFKNFDIGPLAQICADLRACDIPLEIINPNEVKDPSCREGIEFLRLVTRRLSKGQHLLKSFLEKSHKGQGNKIFAGLFRYQPFKSSHSHILYFQPHYKDNVYTYLSILYEIKRQQKDTQLICGGTLFTDCKDLFKRKHSYIDVILGPNGHHEVGGIIGGQKRKVGCTLPDYSMLVDRVDIAPVEYVIGCPFDCFFCDHKARYPLLRFKNNADLCHEIVKGGAKALWFQGAAINLNEQRLRRFCRMLLKKKLVRPWSAPVIPFAMQRSTFDLMAQAGCVHLRWGIESVDPGMLARFNKNLTIKSIQDCLADARRSLIHNSLAFMVGLPDETQRDNWQKMNFIVKNRKLIQSVKVFAFEVRRNTPIGRRPEDFGLILRPDQFDDRRLRYDIESGLDWDSVQVRNNLLLKEFSSVLQSHNILHQIPEEYFCSLVQIDRSL